MEKVRKEVYEGICNVSRGVTDFELGFDALFEFMAENPESKTTRRYIEYHIEKGDPRLDDGSPDFSYLTGRRFVAEEWVHEEDMNSFGEYNKRLV
jgi:hypothetical protein